MANTEISRSQRLDQYVVQERPRISRGFAVKLIEEGKVLVNGQPEKPGYKVRRADEITIDFDEKQLDVIPEIDLPIIYQDDNVVVINKPAGVISHARGKYWDEPSVASFIRQKTTAPTSLEDVPLKSENDDIASFRAGIVHRLDRATSGVMICAKNQDTLRFLQRQFADRKVQKTYIAVVAGHLKTKEAVIDMPIERNPKEPSKFRVGPNGKPSRTHYRVIKESDSRSLIELNPETGRTHQLRVHLTQIGHPIVGDTLYGGEPTERLLLHAASLEITLPSGKLTTFEAPAPKEFNV
jgi:23S rRNA pseudouridine1911/1915/1917 synthase